MGILFYFAGLKVNHEKAITEIQRDEPWAPLGRGRPVDHVLIDVNNLLYNTARKVTRPDALYRAVLRSFKSVFREFHPRKSVFFALDGVAPRAKLATQRQRRFDVARSGRDQTGIDTLQFTPGCKFMQELKQVVVLYVQQLLSDPKFQNVDFIVSGSDRDGEGELKLFQYVNQQPTTESAVVVGTDADLILYGLLSPILDLKILRLEAQTTILDVDVLRNELHKEAPDAPRQRLLDDFVFLSLLMGNDYTPKLRSFSLYPTFSKYCMFLQGEFAGQSLYDRQTHINWPLLCKILAFLEPSKEHLVHMSGHKPARDALGLLMHKLFRDSLGPGGKANVSFSDPAAIDGEFRTAAMIGDVLVGSGSGRSKKAAVESAAIDALRGTPLRDFIRQNNPEAVVSMVEVVINEYFKAKGLPWYNPDLKKPPVTFNLPTPEETEQIARFFEGVLWTMEYLRGNCVNWDFVYPYKYSPTPRTIRALPSGDVVRLHSTPAQPLSPLEFATMVLPPKASRHLPPALAAVMEKDGALHELFYDEKGEQLTWPRNDVSRNADRLLAALRATDASSLDESERLLTRNHPTVLLRFLSSRQFETHPQLAGSNLVFKCPDRSLVERSEEGQPALRSSRPSARTQYPSRARPSVGGIFCLTETERHCREFRLLPNEFMVPDKVLPPAAESSVARHAPLTDAQHPISAPTHVTRVVPPSAQSFVPTRSFSTLRRITSVVRFLAL